jgi:beta-glucanase (GH16 family)
VSAERLEERRLLWGDEFDGPAGAPPDPSIWTHQLGDGSALGIPGWGNGELQHYTAAPANAALDGRGNLVITARRAARGYSSARLVTKDKLSFAFGRVEARIQVPRGAGLWPAFWALGSSIDLVGWPAAGEIDVMEHVGREPRRVFGALHGPGYSGERGFVGSLELAEDLADAFHVFAVDWQPGLIVWSVDDRPYHRATPSHLTGPWVFESPFYLLLNLAVGGTFGGPVAAETAFPQAMRVDYVRVLAAD